MVGGSFGTRRASALERAALVIDAGSLEVWDEDVISFDPLRFADVRPYAERLEDARARTRLGESVLTGRALVGGCPIALVASEFGFLGGSIGAATGERIARAFDRALADRLPLLALTASGGSRMQEGTRAVVQMAKLAAAARRLRAAGLPYVVVLGDPTTGGVLASWGSLGTVTFAMPEALLGFAGPRVVEQLTGTPLDPSVQTAETLLANGFLDAIVAPEELRERVDRVLRVAAPGPSDTDASSAAGPPSAPEPPPAAAPPSPASVWPSPSAATPGGDRAPAGSPAPGDASSDGAPHRVRPRDAWESLLHARDPRRPGAEAVLDAFADSITELRGDRAGHPDDPACCAALARVLGVPAVVVGQRRGADGTPRAVGPAGYRKARRAMAIAGELGLPLVTLVDTPGAELSAEAERSGLAHEIAGCLADISALPVPTLALLLGEGGSGGALAFLAADRVIAAEHASLCVIAPEGASAILYRDREHAAELAAAQGGASWELRAAGIADAIVPEPRPAHEEADAFLARVRETLAAELSVLLALEPVDRLAAREARWRAVGGA